jgi:hypothetical protein
MVNDTKPTIDEPENKPTIDDLIRYQKTLLENYQVNPVVMLIAQNILASLEELKRIKSAEMPVEPETVKYERSVIATEPPLDQQSNGALRQISIRYREFLAYIDALKAVIQRKDAEAKEQWERANKREDDADKLERDKSALIAENSELLDALRNLTIAAENIGGEHVTDLPPLLDAVVTAEQVMLKAKERKAAIDNAMGEGRGK